jgi:hypothetical protein
MRRPSPASVIAFAALFVALSGVSVADVAQTLTGADVRNGSLTGKDFKANSVGARVVKESSLGKVRKARDADRLGGRAASSYRVRCPDNPPTRPVSNTCIELTPRPAAPYSTAASECEVTGRPQTTGRRLPTHSELMTALGDYGITLAAGGELTSQTQLPGGPGRKLDVQYITDAVGSIAVTPDNAAGAKSYRCVSDPLN